MKDGVGPGKVHVMYGMSTFGAAYNLTDLDGTIGFALWGVHDGDMTGESLATGDVNGDTYPGAHP